jgi:hypothetical protein
MGKNYIKNKYIDSIIFGIINEYMSDLVGIAPKSVGEDISVTLYKYQKDNEYIFGKIHLDNDKSNERRYIVFNKDTLYDFLTMILSDTSDVDKYLRSWMNDNGLGDYELLLRQNHFFLPLGVL